MRSMSKLTWIGLLFLLLTGLAIGQSYLGSITGTVTDPNGAVVPEAQVTLLNEGTGIKSTATTNQEGNYTFGYLAVGTYTVTIVKSGFKEVHSSSLTLTTQQNLRFNVTLEVGDIAQSIEVTGATPSLNTENAQLGDVRPREDLLNLPLNNRSTINYFFLSSFNYQGDGSSYSLGGLRGINTNFTIDGTTSNSALFGAQVGPMVEASLESIKEMKVLSSNNSAEYPGVGTIVISSRSGENQLHGSAFFITSNYALNARQANSDSKGKGPTQHNFGGSVGGPIVIPKVYNGTNRTFFYFTWEQQKFPGGDYYLANVPTLKMRNGDFSEILPDTVIKDPTTGQPFTGNIIPKERISSVALGFQNFGFLDPNYGPANQYSGNWLGFFPSAEHNNRFTVRVDHQLTAKDNISTRVNLRFLPLPNQADADIPLIFQRTQKRQVRNLQVSETHIFSPTLLNEFRFGYSRDYSTLGGVHNGASVVQQVGLQGIDLSNKGQLQGVPYVSYNNFSTMQEYPSYFWMAETFELLDNVNWVKGKHNLKTGFLMRRNRGNISAQPQSDFGVLNFDGFATGFDYADFLLGLPINTSRIERSPNRYNRYGEYGFFFQDDFQVSPKLTLNLGMRYELFPPPVDKYDMRFSMDLNSGNLVLASEQSKRLVNPAFPTDIPIVTAEQAGFPTRSLLNGDHNNVGPRFGFAYRPFSGTGTVIRGGYGLFYSRLAWTVMDNFSGGPFQSEEDFQNEIVNGVPKLQFPNPFPAGISTTPTQSVTPVSRDLRTPYTQQWNLTIEHELSHSMVARATYRGFKTNQIPYVANLNQPFPSTDPANKNLFRFPLFYNVSYTSDGGIQKLHALDLALERKYSKGLTFQAGYTLAKNLTDVGDDDESAGIENAYDRGSEMGNVYWMPRQRFVGSVMYDIPYGKGTGPWKQAFGNWQVSAVTVFQSGQFRTPSFGGSDPSNTRVEGGRPDQISDPSLSDATNQRWFNPAAFTIPPVGRFGNSARGVIVGPGLNNVDFGAFKYFRLGEKAKLQLRMTSINFFNHPNWGPSPNTDITSGNVGKITGLQGSKRETLSSAARQIQVGLRIDF